LACSRIEQARSQERCPSYYSMSGEIKTKKVYIKGFLKYTSKAKPYQVHQFLQLVEQYDLELGD
ncbi:MAG TPA: hypothetical protein VHV10_07160, partial [Ktedonobacteraceae bacterium]|nr:hypothetical protein [Ktedonobacteraceae bacterium]